MYPRWMSVLMCYFDLWGFCTQFRTAPNQQIIYRLIFMCHLVVDLYITIVIVRFLKRPVGDNLGTLNDAMKLFSNILFVWLPVSELYFKYRMQRKFWDIIKNIDRKFLRHERLCFKAYLIKMTIFFVVLIAMFSNSLSYVRRSELISFWFAYIFSVSFFKLYFFYYLFYLELIKFELNAVQLRLYGKCSNVQLRMASLHRFKWIRQFYSSIYDLCDVVNNVFGWSNAVAIPLSILLILVDINWIYWKLFNKYQVDVIGKNTPNCKFM